MARSAAGCRRASARRAHGWVGGICCLAGAAWFAANLPHIRQAVRPIYITMGILPQVTASLSVTAELSLPLEPQ